MGQHLQFRARTLFLEMAEARAPYPVTVSFGKPLSTEAAAEDVRLAIMELGSDAVTHRRTRRPAAFPFHSHGEKQLVPRSPWQFERQGADLWTCAGCGSLLLARWMRRRCAQPENIGLLLPNSVGGALANIAALMAGKIPVNLNYTAGKEAMASAVEQSPNPHRSSHRSYFSPKPS